MLDTFSVHLFPTVRQGVVCKSSSWSCRHICKHHIRLYIMSLVKRRTNTMGFRYLFFFYSQLCMQQIMCKESFLLWYIEYCNDFIHTTFVQNSAETRLALVEVSWTRTVSACVPVTQFDHAVNRKLKKNVSRLILINITRCYKSNNWWWIVKIFKCIPLKKKCLFYKIIVMVAPNIVKIK